MFHKPCKNGLYYIYMGTGYTENYLKYLLLRILFSHVCVCRLSSVYIGDLHLFCVLNLIIVPCSAVK